MHKTTLGTGLLLTLLLTVLPVWADDPLVVDGSEGVVVGRANGDLVHVYNKKINGVNRIVVECPIGSKGQVIPLPGGYTQQSQGLVIIDKNDNVVISYVASGGAAGPGVFAGVVRGKSNTLIAAGE